MSWLVPETVRRAVGSHVHPALVNGAGAVVLVLLIVLLVEVQLLQASGASRYRIWPAVRILVVPLALAFAFVAGVRIVELLAYR